MPTSAGGDRALGHLWIEHADRKLLSEALFYMADAKEVLPWWKAFYSGIELIEQRRLLVKVGRAPDALCEVILFHTAYKGSPNPPPPGVCMMMASPACTNRRSLPLRVSMRPSALRS